MEFIFCMEINKFYKVALLFLMEVARHIQSIQNRKLVIFLQYIKEKVSQLLLCSIVMQNIEIFYGGPVMFVVTCFAWCFINVIKPEERNKISFFFSYFDLQKGL